MSSISYKNYSKTKLVGFKDQSLVFQKNNTKSSSWQELPRWLFEIFLFSNKFVSAINTSKSSLPNKCKEYPCPWEFSINNAVYLYRRKLCWWCWNNIPGVIQDLNPRFYLPLWPFSWVLECRNIIYMIFSWVIKITSHCWRSW